MANTLGLYADLIAAVNRASDGIPRPKKDAIAEAGCNLFDAIRTDSERLARLENAVTVKAIEFRRLRDDAARLRNVIDKVDAAIDRDESSGRHWPASMTYTDLLGYFKNLCRIAKYSG